MLQPRLKERTCRGCKERFMQIRSGQAVCTPKCAMDVARFKREKAEMQKRLDERKEDKAKREKQKTISQLEDECRKIVQKIARIRDRNDGCISCHMGPDYSGQWHGSHYRAHGGCSSLQFHLWNIHKACAQCNLYKGGNREGYIRGLLAKPGYGAERLAWLHCQPKSRRFDREYLNRFKAVMGKRMRRLEKRNKTE